MRSRGVSDLVLVLFGEGVEGVEGAGDGTGDGTGEEERERERTFGASMGHTGRTSTGAHCCLPR